METLTVVLAGGRSSRLGMPNKPALLIDGASIIDRVVAAAPPGPMVVAGLADGLTRAALVVREDPPFAGPVAGIASGVAAVPEEPTRVVLLLAGDMPFLDQRFLRQLVAHAPAMARDETGRLQFLCAAWPESLLRARLDELGDVTNAPAKRLYDGLDVTVVDAPPGTMHDIDTPEQLESARARILRSGGSTEASGANEPRRHLSGEEGRDTEP